MLERKIQVIIADDNMEFCEILYDYLNTNNDIEVIGIAHDGIEVLNLITKKLPDIVILDIIMPRLDGIGVMENVLSQQLEKHPKFIILSGIGQEKITQRALALGAEYYIIKPFDLNILVSRIIQFKDTHQINYSCNVKTSNAKSNQKDLEVVVTELMHEIGIPANIKGYQFIRDAIMLAVKDRDIANYITKKLYPAIAKEYKTTPGRVERSIRHAIEVTWNRGQTRRIDKIFGYTVNLNKGKPTNSEFISLVADKIWLETKVS